MPVATYAVEMRQWLADMAHLVAEHTARSRSLQYYDRSAKSRSFDVGDQVLVLLATSFYRSHKLSVKEGGYC